MLIPSDPVNAFLDYPDVPVPHAADGPLAGITFAVKDIYDVAGYVTGCGNREKMDEERAAFEKELQEKRDKFAAEAKAQREKDRQQAEREGRELPPEPESLPDVEDDDDDDDEE